MTIKNFLLIGVALLIATPAYARPPDCNLRRAELEATGLLIQQDIMANRYGNPVNGLRGAAFDKSINRQMDTLNAKIDAWKAECRS